MSASSRPRAARDERDASLLLNDSLFRRMADCLGQPVWISGPDGTLEYANLRWRQMTGASAVRGSTLEQRSQLLHPEDSRPWREAWSAALETVLPFEREYRLWDESKGQFQWVLDSAVPLRDPGGPVEGWCGSMVPIHDRKIAEIRLLQQNQELEERLRQLAVVFETNAMGDWTWDMEADIVTAHPTVWKIHGETEPRLQAEAAWFRARRHPDDVAHTERVFRAAVRGQGPLDCEYRILWPDGSVHWVACFGAILRDALGNCTRARGLFMDITFRKRAQERFSALVEGSQSAQILAGTDHLIVLANRSAEKIFGYERGELIGKSIRTLWRGSGNPSFSLEDQVRLAATGGEPHWTKKDGSQVPVELTVTPVSLEEGKFLLATILDVTATRNASAIEQMFQFLVSSVEAYAIYMLSPQGTILSWNEGAQRIKGYTAKEAIGLHFSTFYPPEDAAAGLPEEALRQALASGRHTTEGWRVRRDGTRFWAAVAITPIHDHRGHHRGFSKITRDITEQRAARQALERSEKEFRLLADAIPQIVCILNREGEVVYFNRRWYEFIHAGDSADASDPADDLRWQNVIHPEELEQTEKAWLGSVASGTPFNREIRLWDRAAQTHRWFLSQAIPLRDDQGQVSRWFATITDIHEQKAAAEKLEIEVKKRTDALVASLGALRVSEETMRQSLIEKDVLLREIHHRVKNNLQIISSLLSMQANSLEDETAIAQLRDTEQRVRSMALIHEQLYSNEQMSSIDFAEYVRRLVPVIFASCGQNAQVHSRLNLSPILLTVEQAIPCGLILNELLANALKYAYPLGDAGEILVALFNGPSGVEIQVSDQGVGLPSEYATKPKKTLGLKIVQVLTRQLRGELTVSGPPGASFTVRFPLAKP